MNRDNREALGMEVPPDVKEALKNADDPQWHAVTKAVRAYYGLDDAEDVLENRLAELQKRRDRILTEIDELRSEVDDIENEMQAIEEKLEKQQNGKAEYWDRIKDITQKLAQNEGRIIAYENDIRDICVRRWGEVTEQRKAQIVDDIKSVADENGLVIEERKLSWSASPTAAATDGRGSNGPDLNISKKNLGGDAE